MRQLAQNVGHFGGNGCAAHPGNKAGIGRADDEIGPNATLLPPRTLDLAKQDAHDRQNHGHLDRDRKNADGGAQGPV